MADTDTARPRTVQMEDGHMDIVDALRMKQPATPSRSSFIRALIEAASESHDKGAMSDDMRRLCDVD